MIQPPPVTRTGAQRAARHELAKAIYHRNSEPLAVRAVRGFGRLIDRVLSSATRHAPAGDLGALAIVVLIVVIVIVVIWRVGVPRRASGLGGILASSPSVTAAEHRALADQAATDNDWHTAVIERMRAVARELEERSILEPRAGRTASELAREAGTRLALAAAGLNRAAAVFNEVAYGGGGATAELYAELVETDGVIRATGRSTVLTQ
jgi:Domain of unknown function (DUF4129)